MEEGPLSWKTEPLSPPSSQSWGLELFEEVGAVGLTEDELPTVIVLPKQEVVDDGILTEEDLAIYWKDEDLADCGPDLDLDDILLKEEEPFSSWLEQSTAYEGISQSPFGAASIPWPTHQLQSKEVFGGNVDPFQEIRSAELLKEFEDVLVQTSAAALTPPDSPKQTNSNFLMFQDMESSEAVEKLVQMVTSEGEGPNSSSSSDQPWSSPSTSCSDSGYDDPDWSPGQALGLAPAAPSTRPLNATEERRLRKKEQNKNAATRYRMKKKQEMEGIIGEERDLIRVNDKLKAEVTEITRELRYIKSLMSDLFKAKGWKPSK